MSSNEHTEHHLGHIVPFKVYLNIFIALIVLTVVTVLVSQTVDLGKWNILLAMIIATAKALLVILYFMHLKFEDVLTWVYAIFPVALLILLMGGIFIDNPLRMDIQPAEVTDTLPELIAAQEAKQ